MNCSKNSLIIESKLEIKRELCLSFLILYPKLHLFPENVNQFSKNKPKKNDFQEYVNI